jgi:FKBP-type peptidyl-prolyl cis-trans isomerase
VRNPLAFLFLTTAATLLAGSSLAQQATAPNNQSSSTAKTPKSTAAKPHSTTTATRTQAPLVLKTQKDKLSYGLGMNFGKTLQKQGVEVDPAILYRGLKDTLGGGKLLMTDEEVKATLVQLQADMRKEQEQKAAEAAETNRKAGEDFLADNKSKEGVVTLPSGLQYKILTEGTGPKPTASDSVVCNYRGTLLDGTEFDSSYKRGQPATFPVTGVIRGWTEALELMPVGSKWQLFIPPDLAYGERGAGADIGPNSTLIFEVELVSIEPRKQP